MNVKKRVIAFFMAAIMIFAILPVMNASAETSGKLTYKVENGKVTITDCDESASGKLTIPSKIDGYPVTSIGYNAFYGCTGLTSITIPDSVTSIGNYSFYECTGLKNITIPNSVTSIGDSAFFSCTGLTSITIPDSVTSTGWGIFCGCTGLTSVTISDGVTGIGKSAFQNCPSLKSITIPDSVTGIGALAFSGTGYYNNSSNWKNDVLYIGNYLVDAKSSITGSYKIKTGTKCIADNAFSGCGSLTSVTIPGSVKVIGVSAFDCCTNLESVSIQSGVTSIGKEAFCKCNNMKSVTIPGSVKFIGEEAFGYISWYSRNTPIPDFTIKGHKGSAAETYAKENNFKFVAHKNNYTSKTTKATTSKNGKITYTCDCGYSYSKSIPKIKSVTLSSDTFTYNGNVRKPTVTVKDSKGNKLKSGTDYTVKYSSGRKNVGKYTVTVTFKGKYSGTKTLTFKIKPKGTSISKLTAGTKKFTVNIKKQATQTTGYQVQYSKNSSMKSATTKTYASTSKTSRTISGLKSATKYYVRVRTYKNVKINGKTYKYFSTWSSIKSVKTK